MKCIPAWLAVAFILACTHTGIAQEALRNEEGLATEGRTTGMRFHTETQYTPAIVTRMFREASEDCDASDDADIEWRPWHAGTMATQVFTEAIGGVVIGGLSLALFSGSKAFDVGGGGGGAAFGSFLLLWGGTSLGLATGAVWGGSFWDGNGRFDMSFLGAAVGLLAGIGTAVAIDNIWGGFAAVETGGIIGTTCFYHLSAEPQYRPGTYRDWGSLQNRSRMSSVLLEADQHVQVEVARIPLEF